MRRLLTGYAVGFNRRHRRHGQLFQNRYKSILCQEDPYLLELVRYIHLNPLRAKIVNNLKELDRYPHCGHAVLLGKRQNDWQDIASILRLFGVKVYTARRRYREFVNEGIAEGKRLDLIGGGMLRSLGGWSAVQALRQRGERVKGDERILGDSDFVEEVLKASEEVLERRYWYRAQGYGFDWLVERVALAFSLDISEVLTPGRYPMTVKARSVLCYWATRELGITTVELSKRLRVSQPTVSQSVKRGEKIAAEAGLEIVDSVINK
jgi:hypothetical protein